MRKAMPATAFPASAPVGIFGGSRPISLPSRPLPGPRGTMRPAPLLRAAAPLAAVLLAACTANPEPAESPRAEGPAAAEVRPGTRLEDVRQQLYDLSADSMQGRFTGSPGMWRAARYLAGRLRALGVQPLASGEYYQRFPIEVETGGQRPRLTLLNAWSDTLRLPPERRGMGVNVVGVIPGQDPMLRGQVVLVGAHYDHLGMGPAVGGDSIYNGADDDASGVVTVLEIARALPPDRPPARTVVILLTTGEEVGLLGTSWYVAHPVLPLENVVANLEVEMVGRPDPLAGGRGRAWLTGYERSSMGDLFSAAGLAIVADPRPAQNVFMRSDNIAFADRGIPAHTLSTFNLHRDYHTPADEADRADYGN